jgi:rare lipoprotein A
VKLKPFATLLIILSAGYSLTSTTFAAETKTTASTPHAIVGKASYYGRHMIGKKTASGERLNPDRLTAASKTLPLGTRVQVTNLANGKTVHVTINDRGPYIRGRVIDLTPRAADALAMRAAGVTKVEVRPELDAPPMDIPVQEADAALPSMVPPANN